MFLTWVFLFAIEAPYPPICYGCGDAIGSSEDFQAVLHKASNGNAEAARRLALHVGYEIANGIRPDDDRRLVVYWLAIAAERGDVKAKFYTARMLARDRPTGFHDYGCRQLQTTAEDSGLEAALYEHKSRCQKRSQ